MYEKRVVITGLGPLTSIGLGKLPLWNSILENKTNVKQERIFVDGSLLENFYFHRIDSFDINDYNLDRAELQEIKDWKNGDEDIDLHYLLAMVKMALDDSLLEYNLDDNEIGLVLAHENAGFSQFFEKIVNEAYRNATNGNEKLLLKKRNFFENLYNFCIEKGYDLHTFMYLHFVAKVFGLHGYSLFVNNACSSGLFALEVASQQIRLGICPVVIVCASDYPGLIYKYLWFKKRGLYAIDGKIRPFSKNRTGLVMGDGGAALVLEDLEHATERNAPIYAEYLGGGFSVEGWKVTLPSQNGEFYKHALIKALQRSKVNASEVDLVVPHGVGTKLTDAIEARVIKDVFGHNSHKPFITALKPFVGHNLGGSGLVELSILLLALDNNYIPPTLNLDELDDSLGVDPVRKGVRVNLRTVAKMSCGFAGHNGVAILRKSDNGL